MISCFAGSGETKIANEDTYQDLCLHQDATRSGKVENIG